MGDYKFMLGGISLYGGGHYTSLIPHKSTWILYDGLSNIKMSYIDPSTIKHKTISVAFYFASQ